MLLACLFFAAILGLLSHAGICQEFALSGLKVWFYHMIPALLPMMILSGIVIRMGLADRFAGLFAPVLGRIYQCNSSACYCIFMGFLCGFPMGAKTVAELYENGKLTRTDARWLLAFCNNLGPAYLMGFVIPLLGIQKPLFCLLGAYGIPLAYGLLLRHTFYKNQKEPCCYQEQPISQGFSEALSNSIASSIHSILQLGGYVIFFCLWNLLPRLFLKASAKEYWGILFEITTGLTMLGKKCPLLSLVAVSFGGLSCMAQTYGVIRTTNLSKSFQEYVLHKVFITLFTFIFYWFSLLFFSRFSLIR